ncbi:Fc.00g041570.m01.CDS01 [Cosmosporella sp. VM-42]
MDADSSVGETANRKRISTACEACRATKIKCQPSDQPGVCRNVLDGPQERPSTPASGPSKTFTIDFDVPSQPEVDENFDTLRDSHAHFIDSLFPPAADSDPLSFASSPMTNFPTPPSSSHTHSIQSLHAKPQFNLDSAASLLASFRGMLVNFPCIVLKPEDTVSSLAATRPFVLLAILAASSGSKTLQGHSLYDEEFRKVLGLKFVAGGERSLELLQGILIYCAWYPFHLRPKNKQAMQYVRMAGDLAHDLELDQEPPELSNASHPDLTSQQLDRIRAYLGWYYAVSALMTAWKKLHQLAAPFTPWTATCCDILMRNSEVEGDLSLATLVRIASNTNAANEAIYESTEQQTQLLLLGLETQQRELRLAMLPHLARSTSVKIADIFFDLYLYGGALLRVPRARSYSKAFVQVCSVRLRRSVATLKKFFAFILSLEQSAFSCFASNDWTKFILGVILAVRISFPLPECPDWDSTWARSELRFDEFLDRMCKDTDLTPLNTRVDVLSASRVVLRVVKAKYDRRLAALNTPAEATPGANQGCPMLDGSLEQYFPVWDAGFGTNPTPFGTNPTSETPPRGPDGQPQMMFHDVWATMTMGWAHEGPMGE